MNPYSTLAAFCAVSVLCAACGDGGDNDSGNSSMPLTGSPPIAINSDNAAVVSRVVIDATAAVQDISDVVGFGSGFAGTSVPGTAIAAASKAVVADVPVSMKTTVSDTIPCTFGGQFTVSGELEDPDTVTVGDALQAEFTSCDEGALLNGRFSFLVTGITGGAQDILSGRFALAADVIIDDFSVTDAGERATGNGDFSFAIDTTSPPVTTIELSGNTFSTADSRDTLTLRNFDISYRDTGGSYTLTTNGTVDSADLQGSVTYQTLVTFEGFGDDYPFAGELQATGADGSSVLLIAVSATDVRLEIDTDGDGAVDNVVDTTWAAIGQ